MKVQKTPRKTTPLLVCKRLKEIVAPILHEVPFVVEIDWEGGKYDEYAHLARNVRILLFKFKYTEACTKDSRRYVNQTIAKLQQTPMFNDIEQIQVEYFLPARRLKEEENEDLEYFVGQIRALAKPGKPKMMALYQGVNPARLIHSRTSKTPKSLSSEQHRILKLIRNNGPRNRGSKN